MDIVKVCDLNFGDKFLHKGKLCTRGKYYETKDMEYSSIYWIDIEYTNDDGRLRLIEKNTMVKLPPEKCIF